MAKYILFFSILTSLAIRIFFISQSKHTADIYLMYNMGIAFLAGNNPYLTLDFNSYPPLAIYLEALSIKLSSLLHSSFVTVFKFWPNLADFICAFIIYKFLRKTKVESTKASLWTAFFLLNPISIVISSAHGQIDSITSLLTVLSIFILTFYPKKFYVYLSALILGVAVTFKPNPMMLLPVFLVFKNVVGKQKIIFLMLVLTPLVLSLIPFVGSSPQQILVRLITYSGVSDISFAAILRGMWYQINASTNLPLNNELLNASKFIFGAGVFFLMLIFAGTKHLAKSSLAIYLLFLSFYFGIGSQYLAWIIPLAVLQRDRSVFLYTLFASLALLGFYLFFGPDILLGKLSQQEPFQTKYIYLYFFGNLMLWMFSLMWLTKIVLNHMKTYFPTFGLVRRRLIYLSSFLFIFSLIPMIYLIIQLFELYSSEGGGF